jgi:hypothetical protein
MVNIDMLKNVKFINRFEPPAKKIYVKMGEDDKAFLDMIGITYTLTKKDKISLNYFKKQ